ncbi:MAG: bifunctional hydroxymethylpyrimidine kinase/phosphomethylpyrimidine kinase [Euryarchaeota archaeon]|nr:bifunctional hydroxymethylpyrimidine kinase/phosphomethylpyrimidine kinase [Euryarchaeota archaeon]
MLVALTIAGSDSVGGAGIQADIKSFASQGIHGAVAITAVTAQNTRKVADIFPLRPQEVVSQIDTILEDVHISGAKTGMLYSAQIARAVAQRLEGENIPLVVDPVMVAGVGDALSGDDLIDAICSHMAPLATILTPNIPEAEALLGHTISNEVEARDACRELVDLGCQAVLLKGGHAEGPTCRDILFHRNRYLTLEYPRVPIRGHGGGCVLAALLTANLAKGSGLEGAVIRAKASLHQAIIDNYSIGGGIPMVAPLSHIYQGALGNEVSSRLLRSAQELASFLPRAWVPEVGCDLAFALPGAISVEDVCGLEGRIIGIGDGALLPAGVAFGASHYASTIILAAMARDNSMRSAITLRFSEEHLARAIEAKLTTGSPDGKEAEASVFHGKRCIDSTIKSMGLVPDVVFDRGGMGREPMIHLLGRSPEEVMKKVRKLVE